MIDDLDPGDFPDRDSLIVHLAGDWAWPTAKLGEFFGLTARRVRHAAAVERATAATPRGPARLTLDEARAMLRDYLGCPYTSPAELESAREWIGAMVAPVG